MAKNSSCNAPFGFLFGFSRGGSVSGLLLLGALACSSEEMVPSGTGGGEGDGDLGSGGDTVGSGGAGNSSTGGVPGTGGQQGPEVDWLENPAALVDSMVGTTSLKGDWAGANLFPGAAYPFGMLQWSPDTPSRPSGGGYEYRDSDITGFSLTHLSGPGCSGAMGDVPILPLVGGLPGGNLNDARQPFSHEGELGTAGYYSVNFGDPQITTEVTATLHAAMARFTFPATDEARLLFKLQNSSPRNFDDAEATIVSNHEISGSTRAGNFCGTGQPYRMRFSMVFDQAFTASEILPESGKSSPGFIWLTFNANENPVIQAKVGISFISVENARGNWSSEIPDSQWSFDAVKADAVQAWNEQLSHIQIQGGSEEDQGKFYTALYHSLLHPNVGSDTNGQYMGFDNQVHQVVDGQRDQHVNYSGWDTYHTQAQLAALAAPESMSDSAQSMITYAEQNGGRLPRWALVHGENGIMPGDPAQGTIAGYHALGARNFDTQKAFEIMHYQVMATDGERWGNEQYMNRGYVPDDIGHDQAGGMSLEYNAADFAFSLFARALGKDTEAEALLKRAQNWQNMFDPSVNMFIPKRQDGSFAPGVHPSSSHGLTEGDAAQYTWFIPYNRKSQLTAMGGPSEVNPRLDYFFSELDDYEGPRALFTNEFQLGVQYWNNHTGEPWKTQEIVSRIIDEIYHHEPGFINNNDDLGGLSSALVWQMLGLYPNYAGSAILSISGPRFPFMRVHLPSGKMITIVAQGASKGAPYVQSLKVDGVESDRSWLDESFVETGALLEFVMGGTPNENWGKDGADPLEAAGMEYLSAYLFVKTEPAENSNPLVMQPGESRELTLVALSARPDVAQDLSWTVAQGDFSLSQTSGSVSLEPGARQERKVNITAPGSTGDHRLSFELTSSLGLDPPTYVLPISVRN